VVRIHAGEPKSFKTTYLKTVIGVSRDELIEVIMHLAFYSGWPTANTALPIAQRVFEEGGR